MKEAPKISIVTVTYNCKATVEKTIQNVLKQTYPNLEYIVIDGGSTDGTKEIIERYADRLAHFVSEPDKGIYDAMNKGIQAATGEWILFRNAGDFFLDPTTVEKVFAWYEDHGEILITGGTRLFGREGYFDTAYRYSDTNVWQRCELIQASTFVRLAVHREHLFPTDLKIAADLYVYLELMNSKPRYAVYSHNISLFEFETGVSSCNVGDGWKERIEILKRFGAMDEEIRKAEKTRRYKIFARKIITLLNKSDFTRRLYGRISFSNWVRQPMDITLANV